MRLVIVTYYAAAIACTVEAVPSTGTPMWADWIRQTEDRRVANGDAPPTNAPSPPNAHACETVMEQFCGSAKATGGSTCDMCLQGNWKTLSAAGCDASIVSTFCPAPPPPAPYVPPAPAPVPPQPAGKPKGPNILLLFPDQVRIASRSFVRVC